MRTQTPTWWRLLDPGEWRGVGERGRSGQEGPPAMTWLEKIGKVQGRRNGIWCVEVL